VEPTPAETAPSPGRVLTGALMRMLVESRGYTLGVPVEAGPFADPMTLSMTLQNYGVAVAGILDRTDPASTPFPLSVDRLIEVGRDCLKYCGTVNGAKMPVGFSIYVITNGPLRADEREALLALKRNVPGLKKVAIGVWILDLASRSVETTTRFNGRFRGRRILEKLLADPSAEVAPATSTAGALPERAGKPLMTSAILATLLLAFGLEHAMSIKGSKPDGFFGVNVQTLQAMGAMNRQLVLDKGEYYRLFSAALLHHDVLHLVMNGIALALSGAVLESLVGPATTLVYFALGALGGTTMGLALNDANVVSAGASGAAMALLAAGFVVAYRYPLGRERTQIQMGMMQFLIPSLIPLATIRTGGKVDYAAHFGGAIAGTLCGLFTLKTWPKHSRTPRFAALYKVFAGVSVVALLGSGASALAHHEHYKEVAGLAELLIDEKQIPSEHQKRVSDVDEWGKGYPRDPRVRMFRGLHYAHLGRSEDAVAELRGALEDRAILDSFFPDGELEMSLRVFLAATLFDQHKESEARDIARPVCEKGKQEKRAFLSQFNLCK
jgi:rhomboid protease GluP